MAIEEAERLFQECKERVEKSADDHLYHLLLQELDKGEDSKKGVNAFHALLFAVLCYANDGQLLRKLKKTDYEMQDLISVDMVYPTDKIVSIYGYPHIMGRRQK